MVFFWYICKFFVACRFFATFIWRLEVRSVKTHSGHDSCLIASVVSKCEHRMKRDRYMYTYALHNDDVAIILFAKRTRKSAWNGPMSGAEKLFQTFRTPGTLRGCGVQKLNSIHLNSSFWRKECLIFTRFDVGLWWARKEGARRKTSYLFLFAIFLRNGSTSLP